MKYGMDLGTGQCQRMFRKLSFQLRKPRHVISKGDDARRNE
jgi:hypothetical protein